MALVVSRASKDYVLQVTSGCAPENVLFCASNGIAALAHVGADSIDGVSTSRWLTEILAGRSLRREAAPSAPSRAKLPDLGQALRALAEGLGRVVDAPGGIALESGFDLHVAGWQWSRNHWRPLVAGLSKDAGSTFCRIEYLPRYWFLDRGKPGAGGRRGFRFNVTAAPDRLTFRDELQRVVDQLRDRTPDQAEDVLRSAMRRIARRAPEAGPDCVSILIETPRTARVRIRCFGPDRGAAAGEGSRHNGHGRIPAMTPWLAGPEGVAPPSVLTSSTEVRLGRYLVSMEINPAS
jgi:hypothetical protein